jgi:hypothetical protein
MSGKTAEKSGISMAYRFLEFVVRFLGYKKIFSLEEVDASKLKTEPKTILAPPECGTDEVRDECGTGDLSGAFQALPEGGEDRKGQNP